MDFLLGNDLVPNVKFMVTILSSFVLVGLFHCIGIALFRKGDSWAQWAAGWGFVSLCFTLAGAGGVPIWIGGIFALIVALIGAVRWLRADNHVILKTVLKAAIVGVSLFLVVSTLNVSSVDGYTHWQPNSLQLLDHHLFPTSESLGSTELYPAFPYNFQFVYYIIGMFLPFLPTTALVDFNYVLIIIFAAHLSCYIRRDRGMWRVPRWGVVALSLLFTTIFAPSFVPNIVLTPYGDFSTSVLIFVFGTLVLKMIEDPCAIESASLQSGFVLMALVNVKQANPAIVFIVIISMIFVLSVRYGISYIRIYFNNLVQVCLPPLIIYGMWRYYLHYCLPFGENKMMPISLWGWKNLGKIIEKMVFVASNKGGHFGSIVVILYGCISRLIKDSCINNISIFSFVVFILYNLFLIVIYIGHFSGDASLNIQSYWRFNTHLGPLFMFNMVIIAVRTDCIKRLMLSRRITNAIGNGAITLCLIGPLAGFQLLKVDLKDHGHAIRESVRKISSSLTPGKYAVVVIPDVPQNVFWAFKGGLTQSDLRRSDVKWSFHHSYDSLPSGELQQADVLWLVCPPEKIRFELGIFDALGASILLVREGDGWRMAGSQKEDYGLCRLR